MRDCVWGTGRRSSWLDWNEWSEKAEENDNGKVTVPIILDLVGFAGHCKDFGFYRNWNGKSLEDFEQKSDMIYLYFKRITLATMSKIEK